MNRRTFLTRGGSGLVAAALGSLHRHSPLVEAVRAEDRVIQLSIGSAIAPMVDGTPVYSWAFSADGGTPRVPGPVIRARAGDVLKFVVTNNLDEPHAFAIAGVAATPEIWPGETRILEPWPVPAPGTYLYLDPLNAPANRLLGLHGALVVLPGAPASGDNLTPYAAPTPAMQRLFNDLTNAASMFGLPTHQGRLAGNAWDPTAHGKDLVWLFGAVDPRWHARAQRGETFSGAAMASDFVPRYFSMNGKSGYYSATDPDTAPAGAVGEPCLLRCLQVAGCAQAPHIHGNHVFELTRRLADEPVEPLESVRERDTWLMDELRIADVLLPYRKPPDIWPWPPHDLSTFERQLPLFFPMHCHNQPSNTAGGGSYPQGTITHWAITGFPGVTKIVGAHH